MNPLSSSCLSGGECKLLHLSCHFKAEGVNMWVFGLQHFRQRSRGPAPHVHIRGSLKLSWTWFLVTGDYTWINTQLWISYYISVNRSTLFLWMGRLVMLLRGRSFLLLTVLRSLLCAEMLESLKEFEVSHIHTYWLQLKRNILIEVCPTAQ